MDEEPGRVKPSPTLSRLRDGTAYVLGTVGFVLQMYHWMRTGELNTWFLSVCGLLLAGPEKFMVPFIDAILDKVGVKRKPRG